MEQALALRRIGMIAVTAAVVAALLVVLPVGEAESQDASTGGPLHRLAADYADFGGSESATEAVPNTAGDPTDPGGIVVYHKRVRVPSGHNVLYVTISTTGDTHDGAASCFSATVDDATFMPFNVGQQGAARCADGAQAPGWIALLKLPESVEVTNCDDGGGGSGDCHDNSIYYTWCTRTAPGLHEVKVHMASSMSGSLVFIENSHFFVDSNRIRGNACEAFDPGFGEPFTTESTNQ